ncbi:hypothetical protein ACFSW8_07410 [Rubritalea tangerina]|uniref:PilZ domain-containing protein n=2 Tax=Rubritalea tangerina TaxID=430798 RepID=A0ABW4Z9U7_9BACT
MRFSPTLGTARELELEWAEDGGMFDYLKLDKVRASYTPSGFLGASWEALEITSEKSIFSLALSGRDHFFPEGNGGGFDGFTADGFRSRDVTVYVDGNVLLEESVAQFHWENDGLRLSMSGGDVALLGWGGYVLDNAFVQPDRDGKESIHARLINIKNRGSLQLSGALLSGEGKLGRWDIAVEKVDVGDIFPSEFLEVIGMVVDEGTGWMQVTDGSVGMELECQIKSMELGRLPSFARLAESLRRNLYRRPAFRNGGKCRIVQDSKGWSISNIDVSDDGVLALKGEVMCMDGRVSGVIEIGLPLNLRKSLQGNFVDGAFSREKDGYLWQVVNISTNDEGEVVDDLYKLYSRGEEKAVIEQSVDTDTKRAPKTQRELEEAFEEMIAE